MITYREILPHPDLREYIECYWEFYSESAVRREICLPDAGPSWVFPLSHPYWRKPLTGQLKEDCISCSRLIWPAQAGVYISQEAPSHVAGVRFMPYGLGPLAGGVNFNWACQSFAPEVFWPQVNPYWLDAVVNAGDLPFRARLLDHFFLDALKKAQPIDAVVKTAVEWLTERKGCGRLKDFLETHHLAKSTLEKKFKDQTGIALKDLRNMMRFNFLVLAYDGNSDLSDLAFEFGFFDQSHFIHNCKAFTGMTPRQFFQSEHVLIRINKSCFRKMLL